MVGVSVTFDVDGVAGLATRGVVGVGGRLSSCSEAVYGVRRGLERVLEALAQWQVRATFYVPGVTLQRDVEVFAAVLAGGHELAHHGFAHLPSHALDAAGQREELERGLEAFAVLGIRPQGYRSPAWELTPETLELLGEHGFAYDSSLMDDDRPYRLAVGERELVELPVHWSLDDVPHFAAYAHPDHVLELWKREADLARHEQRHLTYTLHPDISARPQRLSLLHGLLAHLHHHHTPTHTHTQAAARVLAEE